MALREQLQQMRRTDDQRTGAVRLRTRGAVFEFMPAAYCQPVRMRWHSTHTGTTSSLLLRPAK